MVFFGLAGEANHHIRANRRIGQPFANELHAPLIMLGAIPPAHRRKNAVRAGLASA